MPILIKTGKLKAIEDIAYATNYTVYKKYICGNAPVILALSPLQVKEDKEYTCLIDFNETTGEGKLLNLCECEKKQTNEILGVLKVRVLYNKIKAGKFEVVIDLEISKLKFPLRGRAYFKGKKIYFKIDKEKGNCILLKEN